MRKTKSFDCVEMKRAIQEKIGEETKGMSWKEEREHFRKDIRSSSLAEKWARIEARQGKKKAI